MFTGIIEEIGRVVSLTKAGDVLLWNGERGEGWVLVIAASIVLQGAYLGCSIAVNGTCLTVTAFDDTSFTVGCAPETMRRTNLIDLRAGSPVNLERSMAADSRNSGHFVQGHVDETGTIREMWREGDSLWVRVAVSRGLVRYIVPKGYIAVDGTSLTVCEVYQGSQDGDSGEASTTAVAASAATDAAAAAAAATVSTAPSPGRYAEAAPWFTFMLIAYTQKHIIVPLKRGGERVNLEVDVLGKYVDAAAAALAARVDATAATLTAAMGKLEAGVMGALAKLEARVAALETAAAATTSSTGSKPA